MMGSRDRNGARREDRSFFYRSTPRRCGLRRNRKTVLLSRDSPSAAAITTLSARAFT